MQTYNYISINPQTHTYTQSTYTNPLFSALYYSFKFVCEGQKNTELAVHFELSNFLNFNLIRKNG